MHEDLNPVLIAHNVFFGHSLLRIPNEERLETSLTAMPLKLRHLARSEMTWYKHR
jgi:hypothetical protein